eukprot:COSAG01_NODE_3879_length_5595_cov_34.137918_3_plen_66_part_00
MILQHDTHALDGLRAVAPMVRGGMPRLRSSPTMPCCHVSTTIKSTHTSPTHTHTLDMYAYDCLTS